MTTKSDKPIQIFHEFDQYYQVTKGQVQAKHPDFHIFRFRDLGDQVVEKMGPFQTNYYQFALGINLFVDVSVFTQKLVAHEYSLVIFLPGQILQWERTGPWDGYVINVKESFLQLPHHALTPESYRFLHDIRPLVFRLQPQDYWALSHFYELLLAEHAALGRENLAVIHNLLSVLLVYIHRLLQQQSAAQSAPAHQLHYQHIASRFKKLVLDQYLTSKSVAYYAEQLRVTPSFLNKCVQQLYAQSPKEVINQVMMNHAQTLLRNTDVPIKELADQLNFDDYSHFVKFFKGATGLTPAEFRRIKA